MKSDSKPATCTVGIDLGTTRSVVAHLDEFGRPRTILNSEGDLTTPSVVLFEPGNVVVGREALRALAATPEAVAQFAKRELGNAQYSMTFDGVNYPPEMIQSLILGKLRRDAERFLGQVVQSAVITVPAFFDEPKRRATIDAGLLGGLEVKAIINEPTAAAIAFGAANGMLDSKGAFQTPQRILVYDLGGGTFDVSLLQIKGKQIDVLAISGNSRLGGVDWDKCLVDWMGQQFETEHGVEAAEVEAAHANLLREAEELKHALSARTSVPVRARLGNAVLRSVLTRKEFADLTAHLLDRTRFTVKKLLQDAETNWSEIDRVLLVGGSTRMPQVSEMLEKDAGGKIDSSLSPEEAVAHGAAVFAKIVDQRESGSGKDGSGKDTEELSVTDVNAHHLGVIGVERATGRRFRQVMIGKNTPLPAKKSARFETAHDGQANVLVRIVEGGDARGQHATMIGKLVIYNLPRGLPARTPVDVCVRYDRDGIIEVEAEIPSTGSKASVRIERAAGLSVEEKESLRDKNEEILEALGLD